MTWILALVAALVAVALLPPLRRIVLTGPIFAIYKRMLPAMSQTEREALEAGTVWWEGELFSGKPDWNKLHAYRQPQLTAEEQSFLDNECETLCAMTRDWETTQVHHDLSPEAWACAQEQGLPSA
jgi:acyl-CoA dehydrogenase